MPYIINVAITVVLGLLYNASDKSEENKKRYLIVIWICLSLVAGLRGAYALGDTEGYRSSYLRAASMDFPTFFKTFKIDSGFYYLHWACSKIGIPWQAYLLLISFFVLGTFCYWIYENSEDVVASMIIFEAMFLTVWMGSLRQDVAMALLLIALMLEKRGVKKIFLIGIIVVAVLFHSTALIVLVYIPLRMIPINKISVAFFAAFSVFAFVFRNNFLSGINSIASLLGRTTYENFYKDNPTNLIFLTAVIACLAIFSMSFIMENYPQVERYFCTIFIMLAFLALGGGAIVRLAWYFGPFFCVMLPVILKRFKPYGLAISLAMGILIILYLRGVDTTTYYFFWNETRMLLEGI